MNKKKLFFLFIDALEEGNMCSKFGVQAKMLSSSREGGTRSKKDKPTVMFRLQNAEVRHNFLEPIIPGSVPVVVASQGIILFGY